jgi:beta-N-acetylhexosaminidase
MGERGSLGERYRRRCDVSVSRLRQLCAVTRAPARPAIRPARRLRAPWRPSRASELSRPHRSGPLAHTRCGATVAWMGLGTVSGAARRRACAFVAVMAGAALLAALLGPAVASADPAGGWGSAATPPTVAELVGQRLVVALRGTTPSPQLLARVRRGEIGGVILFGGNVATATQLRSLATRLQAAARAGGRPPLLVAVDQEGGEIRRLPWAGPAASAADLGRESPVAVRRAARAAGVTMRSAGVNLDLAPVLDVPAPGSFMAAEQRTFSSSPARVGLLATAFTAGLADAGVFATAKHFPGIGRAVRSTDRSAVTLSASVAALDRDLDPFRRAVAAHVPVVMLSNASYSAFGPAPAAWSAPIQALLRHELGFRGVTITDALEPAAATRGRTLSAAALLAVRAGVDLVLLTGSEASSAAVFRMLVANAADGGISRASLLTSNVRILALKQQIG